MIYITQRLALAMLMLSGLAGCKDKEQAKPADPVAAFLGDYDVQASDPAKKYSITFAKDYGQPGYVIITNFADALKKNKVYGQVSGNKIIIPMQSFSLQGGKTLILHGEGTLNRNTLSLHYRAGGDYEETRDEVALRNPRRQEVRF